MRIAQYQTEKGTYTLYEFDSQISLSYTNDDGTKKTADFETFSEGMEYLKRLSE